MRIFVGIDHDRIGRCINQPSQNLLPEQFIRLVVVIHFHLPSPRAAACQGHGPSAAVTLVGQKNRIRAAFELRLAASEHDSSDFRIERFIEIVERRQIRPLFRVRIRIR